MVPVASVLALARALASDLDKGGLLVSGQVIGRTVHLAEFATRIDIDLSAMLDRSCIT